MTTAGPADEDGDDLSAVLAESRELGFLGPGPLGPQIEHARGFASTLERAPESFLDLGAGGGLPGLVLAAEWPEAEGVLLDAMVRRTEFLRRGCDRLGLAQRLRVVCERAEVAAHQPDLRGRFEVVVARSFGRPAVTAECAVGFLAPGGRLVVSEPPTDEERWPPEGLERLGLRVERLAQPGSRYAVLSAVGPVDDQFPRRTGLPGKRPIWS